MIFYLNLRLIFRRSFFSLLLDQFPLKSFIPNNFLILFHYLESIQIFYVYTLDCKDGFTNLCEMDIHLFYIIL